MGGGGGPTSLGALRERSLENNELFCFLYFYSSTTPIPTRTSTQSLINSKSNSKSNSNSNSTPNSMIRDSLSSQRH